MVLKKFIAPKISVMRPIDMIIRPILAKPWWPLPKCILKTLSNSLMKKAKGKANPQVVNKLLREML